MTKFGPDLLFVSLEHSRGNKLKPNVPFWREFVSIQGGFKCLPHILHPCLQWGTFYNLECPEIGIYPDILRQGGVQTTEDSPEECGQLCVHRPVQTQGSAYMCCKAREGMAMCTDTRTFSVRPTLEAILSLLRCSQHTSIHL